MAKIRYPVFPDLTRLSKAIVASSFFPSYANKIAFSKISDSLKRIFIWWVRYHSAPAVNNKMAESQKDFRIKKLEEQLLTVKKNNKLNKSLLKQRDEQIKNLMDNKNKQDKLIKQYEIKKSLKQKNLNHTTKAKCNKINFLEDISKSYNPNNDNCINTSNNNLIESKKSFTKINN